MNRIGFRSILTWFYKVPPRISHSLSTGRVPSRFAMRRFTANYDQSRISNSGFDSSWTQHGHLLTENFLHAARSISYIQDHSGVPNDEQMVALERRLGHIFTHRSLLNLALTHRSAASPNSRVLSWMGDAALQMAVTEQLAGVCGCTSVGNLTNLRCELVSRENCTRNAVYLGLEDLMVFGKGVMVANKGKPSNDMMAEAFEAVIGALYVDGGLDAVRKAYGRNFPLSGEIIESVLK
jgi:hypothetical protein